MTCLTSLYSARMHLISGSSTAGCYAAELLYRHVGANSGLQLPVDLVRQLELSVGTGVMALLLPTSADARDTAVQRAIALRLLLTHRYEG